MQIVHEISSFSDVFYKRNVVKNFSKFTDKLKKQSSGNILSKNVLRNFAKFTENHICQNLFLRLRGMHNALQMPVFFFLFFCQRYPEY